MRVRLWTPCLVLILWGIMALPSTPILDNFNRANEGPPPGPLWSSADMTLVSNRMLPPTDIDGNNLSQAALVTPFGFANQEAYISIYFDQATAEANDVEHSQAGLFFIILQDDLGVQQYSLHVSIFPPIFDDPGIVVIRITRSDPGGETLTTQVTRDYLTGDAFGVSIADNVLTGYHKPAGGNWIAVVSAFDTETVLPPGDTIVSVNAYSGTAPASVWSLDDFGGGEHAPTVLTATAISSSRIDLAWTDVATGETGYSIERSLDGITFAEIDTEAANAEAYSNTGLTQSTLYYYRVRAFNVDGYYDYSNIASATTDGPPAAPTLLTAVAVSPSQINLAWTDNAADETGFSIERSLDGVAFSEIDTTGADVTTRSNTGLSSGTLYYYRVRAFNDGGYSDYSNIASATTMAPPTAPTLLTATAMSSSRIDLDWTDNATNETGYKIERGLDGINFTQIAVIGPNTDEYSDLNLAVNTRYYYRVRAFNEDGDSAYSNIASATTLTRCAGGFSYFDVLLRAARLLENLHEGQATDDGTTTTLIDSHLGAFIGSGDDDFNGGSLFWKTHKDSTTQNELLDTVTNEDTASGTLDLLPAIVSTVVITAPHASVTDDGAGVFETTPVTTAAEPLVFTADPDTGIGSAQTVYRQPIAGTVIISENGSTPPVTDTDNGVGAIDVWIPITQYVTLGTMEGSRTFRSEDDYPASELPITPGSVTLQTPAGNVTDDGAGAFSSGDIVLTSDPILWVVDDRDPGLVSVALLSGVNRIGNVTPGTLTITWDDGVAPPESDTDDGAGNIDVYANGTTYPGVINYDTGIVFVDDMLFADAAWLVAETADFLFDATYKAITGTINYTTGEINLTFDTGQTGTVSVFSLISHPHFVTAAISYTTGLISLTGLAPGDATWLNGNLDYTVTYNHRLIVGTINYNTGAIALTFDRLVTGNVLVSYSSDTSRIYIPVIMRVSDFATATGTVTFEPSPLFTLSTSDGDGYGLSSRRYPYYLMLQKLNEALSEIKHYVLDQADIAVSEAGLLSVTTTNELDLADTVRIFKIWNGNTDQDPQDWQLVSRFQHQNGKVRFYDYLPWNTIRIQYFADIPDAESETDCLPQQIDATWLAYETAVKCCRWRLFQPGADEKSLTTQINDLMARATKARARMNLYQPQQAAMKLPIIPDR